MTKTVISTAAFSTSEISFSGSCGDDVSGHPCRPWCKESFTVHTKRRNIYWLDTVSSFAPRKAHVNLLCSWSDTHVGVSEKPMQQRWVGWTRLVGRRQCPLLHHPFNAIPSPVARHHLLLNSRQFHACLPQRQEDHVPLRKQLKAAAKAAKRKPEPTASEGPDVLEGWELTVGIEIHAQLNTAHKLFSCQSCSVYPSQPLLTVASGIYDCLNPAKYQRGSLRYRFARHFARLSTGRCPTCSTRSSCSSL